MEQLSQADQFIPVIARGSVSPTGHPHSMFPVSVSPDGSLIANTLTGQQKVGQVEKDGSYRLANGQTGNIFQDEKVRISYSDGGHPFLNALLAAERQRAIAGSEIPLLRGKMAQLGLSGKGVKVAIIDPYEKVKEEKEDDGEKQKDAQPSQPLLPPLPPPTSLLNPGNASVSSQPDWKISQHSRAVEAVLNDPVWGVAPGAQVIQLPSPPMEQWKPKKDELSELTNGLANEISGIFERGANQLSAAIRMNDPALRLASITWGTSRLSIYSEVFALLNEKDRDMNYKYPVLRRGVLGGALSGTNQERFYAVAQFVDRVLSLPTVQQAFQKYLAATQAASARGIIPVVSMANDRNLFRDVPEPPPGSAMNLLACSPYVIAVASSNTNQTPGYYADDVISPFSSAGDGDAFNPTIAAPGQEVGVGHPYGPHGRNMVVQGTSFSTPFTCGVIALMLEANPGLTFAQVKQILQQSATPVMHSPADEGAGVLNPQQAVVQALNTRQRIF
jgi:hypothetical protein